MAKSRWKSDKQHLQWWRRLGYVPARFLRFESDTLPRDNVVQEGLMAEGWRYKDHIVYCWSRHIT